MSTRFSKLLLILIITLSITACGGGSSSSGSGSDESGEDAIFDSGEGVWNGLVTLNESGLTSEIILTQSGNAVSGTLESSNNGFVANLNGARNGNTIKLDLTNHRDVGDLEYEITLTLVSDTSMKGSTLTFVVEDSSVIEGSASLIKS